jgi:hypothetical protein
VKLIKENFMAAIVTYWNAMRAGPNQFRNLVAKPLALADKLVGFYKLEAFVPTGMPTVFKLAGFAKDVLGAAMLFKADHLNGKTLVGEEYKGAIHYLDAAKGASQVTIEAGDRRALKYINRAVNWSGLVWNIYEFLNFASMMKVIQLSERFSKTLSLGSTLSGAVFAVGRMIIDLKHIAIIRSQGGVFSNIEACLTLSNIFFAGSALGLTVAYSPPLIGRVTEGWKILAFGVNVVAGVGTAYFGHQQEEKLKKLP